MSHHHHHHHHSENLYFQSGGSQHEKFLEWMLRKIEEAIKRGNKISAEFLINLAKNFIHVLGDDEIRRRLERLERQLH
uniref:De novo designed protein H3mb n=1 Tax=Escherichia coli TaxID=562 RepID=UPI002015565E|nr:Chain G, De novo designed protein H3mb [Escherichia coli]7RDH_H Chain H, De novo designed protein H3mb [Escherichia coli]